MRGEQATARLIVTALTLLAAIAATVGVFLTVAAAPCDPSLPVLSDGTREAPGNWAYAWYALMVASAISFSAAIYLTARGSRYAKRALPLSLAGGAGLLIGVWAAGAAFWSSQCPA